MPRLPASVTASTSSTTTQTQCGAISLNMAKTLTMVALLGFGGPGVRTAIRLMTRLFALLQSAL